ncbi:MAG TPA: PAS domain S-box protein [Desulfomonilaceae bacterium]|nr:PAS domain S-box protein [Desulfomonilaceae bacterium]
MPEKTGQQLLDEISRLAARVLKLQESQTRLVSLEKALNKSDTKFRTLTEKSVVGVYLIQDTYFRYVNPKLAEIFGYDADELVDKIRVLDVVHPEDRALLEKNLKTRLSGEIDSMNYQFRGLKKNGSVIHVEAYGSRMDYEGSPAVIGSLVDITNRIESEQALRKSEHLYKTLVEEINDGYFVVQNERITFANQAFCSMHGTRLEEVIGKPFLFFVSSEFHEHLREAYSGALEGRPVNGQIRYVRIGPSQDEAATEVKARMVDLGEGPVLIGICRDISDRVEMEMKMRDHERMAYIGQLSASLSHEIRNPLSSIKLNLQILARKLNVTGNDGRRLEITVHEVSRLEGILHQLLDLARPLEISLCRVDPRGLVGACVELLRAKNQEKGIEVVERYSKKLPIVQLDAAKVEQALINLMLNALDATPEGGRVTLRVKSVTKPVSCIEFSVHDTGSGINPQQMTRLFTPFVSSKRHGIGLGLSNVRRIVEAHDGNIEVRSQPGRGTTFCMRFPCRS